MVKNNWECPEQPGVSSVCGSRGGHLVRAPWEHAGSECGRLGNLHLIVGDKIAKR